ncbi:MAG TPA: LytTR family transcriptional regulator DNA-binding domain-containing protein [Thermoanaerobaculia bacterium]|nr:LytTR family transcriptional regulator DNA-binding domain-containing protein [Thermoanaerobaculia bacterium]
MVSSSVPKKQLRAIVVDDEPLARRLVAALARTEPDLDVVAECANAREAIEAIATHAPDVILLDIELPGGSGMELARQIDPVEGPVLVFITAHEQFAAEAYDAWPADYVMKPVQTARWKRALNRVRRIIQLRADAAGEHGPEPAPPGTRYLDRTFVRSEDRIHMIRLSDVAAAESVGNYVKLHTAGGVFTLRCTLGALELRLDPRRFVRVHRSYIVNVDAIREIVALSHGEYKIVLARGMTMPLTRRYRGVLDRFAIAADGR